MICIDESKIQVILQILSYSGNTHLSLASVIDFQRRPLQFKVGNQVDPLKSKVPILTKKFHHFALPRSTSLYFV